MKRQALVVLLGLATFCGLERRSEAQTPAASTRKSGGERDHRAQAAFESTIRERVVAILRAYVPAHEFHVAVSATLKNPSVGRALPYAPVSASGIPGIEAMGDRDLRRLARSVHLRVRIASRFDLPARGELQEILVDRLGLLASAGDRIEFSSMALPQAPTEAEAAKTPSGGGDSVGRTDPQVRSRHAGGHAPAGGTTSVVVQAPLTNGDIERAKAERDAARQELSTLKAALIVSETQRAAGADRKEGAARAAREHLGWRDFLRSEMSSVATLAGGLALALALLYAAGRLSRGFAGIAASLRRFSGVIDQQGSGGSASNERAALIQSQTSEGREALHERMAAISAQIVASLDPGLEAAIFERIETLAERPGRIREVVAIMQVLPSREGARIFEQLSPRSQQLIVKGFRQLASVEVDGEAKLLAAERLSVWMLQESLRIRALALRPAVLSRLARYNAASLLSVLPTLDDATLIRLLAYLTPERLGEVVAKSKDAPDRLFEKLTALFGASRHMPTDESVDECLLQAFPEEKLKAHNASQAVAVPGYVELLEQVDLGTSERMLQLLDHTDPSLKRELSRFIVTFGDIWDVDQGTRTKVLAELSVSEIANLVRMASPAEAEMIRVAVSPAKRQFIADELEHELQGDAEATARARAKVVQILRRAKTDAVVDAGALVTAA